MREFPHDSSEYRFIRYSSDDKPELYYTPREPNQDWYRQDKKVKSFDSNEILLSELLPYINSGKEYKLKASAHNGNHKNNDEDNDEYENEDQYICTHLSLCELEQELSPQYYKEKERYEKEMIVFQEETLLLPDLISKWKVWRRNKDEEELENEVKNLSDYVDKLKAAQIKLNKLKQRKL